MRFKPMAVPAAASLALVAGTCLYWASPASADQGSGPSGGSSNALYVSNLKGGTPAPMPTVAIPSLARSVAADRRDHGPSRSLPAWQTGCASAQYTTIGAAVTAASSGQTIVVCPGVYDEMVTVPAGKALTIDGMGDPIIDAKGLDNGVQVLGSGTTIEGLSVGYALGEGILVGGFAPTAPVSNVTVRDNFVFDNDRGNPTGAPITSASYGQCNANPQTPTDPGDCGEGIHLLSATHSSVKGNTITANSGGILLTDENGPTDANTIAGNLVVGNTLDCGITLASHSLVTPPAPVSATTGGVYGNAVRGNVVLDNGVLGQGGGVLLAAGSPGASVYGNTVEGNALSGNGLAGVTLHSHAPGQDMNGNVVSFNSVGANNLGGDSYFGGNTPPDLDLVTTGIIVAGATAAAPISITIVGNRISNDVNGIWMTKNVTATTTSPANVFNDVANPTVTAP